MVKLRINPYWLYALLRRREAQTRHIYRGPFEQFRRTVVDIEWECLTTEEKRGWKEVVDKFKQSPNFKTLTLAYKAKKKVDMERKARRKAYNKSVRGPEKEEAVSDSEDDRFMEAMSGAAVPHPYCVGDKDDPHFLYRQLLNQLLDGLSCSHKSQLDNVVISGRSMEVSLNESVQRKIQFGNSSVPVWKSSKSIGQAHAALKKRSPKNYPADSYSVKGNDNKSRQFKGPVKELKVGNIRFLAIYQSGKGKEAHFVNCIHDSIGCVFVDEDKALYTEIKHFIPGYKPFNQQEKKKKGEMESEGEDDDVPSKKKKKSQVAQNKKEESLTDEEEEEESELSDYEGTSKMMMKNKK